MSRFRLICPNCGAQYDVPMDVIPARGRDVQCSNCGHTWFQAHAQAGSDAAPVEPVAAPRVRTPASQTPAERPAQDTPQAEADTSGPADTPADRVAPTETPSETAPGAIPDDEYTSDIIEDSAPVAVPPRRKLDPAVVGVLREEAAYENQRRMQERSGIAAQTTPAPSPGDTPPAKAQADSTGAEAALPASKVPPPPEPKPAPTRSRSEVFPDVEEVSQSLRQRRGARRGKARLRQAAPETGGSGFAKGFVLVMVAAGLALAVYSSAPQIAESVPEAAPLLEAYTAQVDDARRWLDDTSTELLMRLDAMSSEAAQGDGA